MAAEESKSSPLADIIRKLNGTAEAALEIQLPQGGEHYYYSNFPSYSGPLKEGLATIQQLLITCESVVRSRRAPPPDWTNADEVATWSSELLDDVTERIDTALDAERARARGRPEPRRASADASAAAAADNDTALLANLPSFGGSAVRPSRPGAGRGGPVRHAAALPRPQDRFDPPPDNRREVPFRPRVEHLAGLTREPCDPRAYQAAPGAPEDFPHPFAADLDALAYRPDQLGPPAQPPRPPAPPEDTPLVWVDGAEALAGLVAALGELEVVEVAVDLEHHSHRSFQGFTCLMQISTRTTDYVVDTLALRNQLGPALARVFADPRVVKVLHGADSDVEWLQRDFGLFPVNMFDTGQAARVLGLPSFGLAHLLETFCGVQPDKRYQLADWRVRPLSTAMLHYARSDTHYLLYVYDKLREQLAALPSSRIPPSLAVPLPPTNPGGAMGLVLERSRQLCLKKYRKPSHTPNGYMDLLLRWQLVLNPQQTAAFAALLAWRDGVCRAEDESTGYVLSKAQLVALAQAMPEDAKRLREVLGRAISEVVGRRMGELLAAIQDAKHRPIERPAAAATAPPAASSTVAATAPASATPRPTVPDLKPRAVAPIRSAVKAAVTPAAADAADVARELSTAGEAPTSGGDGPPRAATAAGGEGTAAAAVASDDIAAANEGLPTAPAVAATAAYPDVGSTAPADSPGGAFGGSGVPAPAAATESELGGLIGASGSGGGGLKPRTLKPPPIKPATASRSAALFGGGAASAPSAMGPAVGAAARRVQLGAGGSGGTSMLGAIFGSSARPSAQPTAGAATTGGSAGGGGGEDDEERLAKQRAKRLRTTFTLPFAATAAAAAAPLPLLPQPSVVAAEAADRAAGPGGNEEHVAAAAGAARGKPSVTAADIRAAVEALRAAGEGVEIAMGADGQGTVVPPGESGGGDDDASPSGAAGREAPAARSVAGMESDGEGDDAESDGDGVAADGGGEGGDAAAATPRVAGLDLGLDILDYVPVPLSQMVRKDKGDKDKKRRAGRSDGDKADQGSTAAAAAGAVPGPKRRRFTTEFPAITAASGNDLQYGGGESNSDGDDSSDSDGGHAIGPFAKKKSKKAQKPSKEQRQKQQRQVGAQREEAAHGRGRGRRGPKPPLGLGADFPRSNLRPTAVPEGGGRGGRGRVRDGGRGGGRGGRQPAAFNPYDIPDEFLIKGGKRSAVMPRSGNRTFTFK